MVDIAATNFLIPPTAVDCPAYNNRYFSSGTSCLLGTVLAAVPPTLVSLSRHRLFEIRSSWFALSVDFVSPAANEAYQGQGRPWGRFQGAKFFRPEHVFSELIDGDRWQRLP